MAPFLGRRSGRPRSLGRGQRRWLRVRAASCAACVWAGRRARRLTRPTRSRLRRGVRPMIERFRLADALKAVDAMMRGTVRFRAVIEQRAGNQKTLVDADVLRRDAQT